MADRKGPVIFGIPGTEDGASAVAVGRMGNITQHDKDAALEIAVRGLLGDARRSSPVDYAGAGKPQAEPATAPGGNGWRDRGPLLPPPGVSIIDRMVEAMQPHQPGNPEYRAPAPAIAATAEAAPVSAAPKAEAVAEAPPAAAEVTRRRLT
jgi:hypothetical protein